MYLSNAEKETLFLTGYGDVPPWAVRQGLEQALARGTYVPGEEALRLRLAEQLDLEERLATAGGKTTEQQAKETQDDAFAEGFQQGLVEGVEASQEAAAIADFLAFPGGHEGSPDDDDKRMRLVALLHKKPSEEPPADGWRSPLEIVTEGAQEPEQGPPGEEDAAPAAPEQQIEDRDFSGFTKAQLVTFAWDQFGVELKRTDSRDQLIIQVQRLVDEANG